MFAWDRFRYDAIALAAGFSLHAHQDRGSIGDIGPCCVRKGRSEALGRPKTLETGIALAFELMLA